MRVASKTSDDVYFVLRIWLRARSRLSSSSAASEVYRRLTTTFFLSASALALAFALALALALASFSLSVWESAFVLVLSFLGVLSLFVIHIFEPTRLRRIASAAFCLKLKIIPLYSPTRSAASTYVPISLCSTYYYCI